MSPAADHFNGLCNKRVVVQLLNGNREQGTFLSSTDTSIVLQTETGTSTYSRGEVAMVTKIQEPFMPIDIEIAHQGNSQKGTNASKLLYASVFEFEDTEKDLPEMDLSKVKPSTKIDQFLRNEMLTGIKSSYDFNSYTIDLSHKAPKIERSTEKVPRKSSYFTPSYKEGAYIPKAAIRQDRHFSKAESAVDNSNREQIAWRTTNTLKRQEAQQAAVSVDPKDSLARQENDIMRSTRASFELGPVGSDTEPQGADDDTQISEQKQESIEKPKEQIPPPMSQRLGPTTISFTKLERQTDSPSFTITKQPAITTSFSGFTTTLAAPSINSMISFGVQPSTHCPLKFGDAPSPPKLENYGPTFSDGPVA